MIYRNQRSYSVGLCSGRKKQEETVLSTVTTGWGRVTHTASYRRSSLPPSFSNSSFVLLSISAPKKPKRLRWKDRWVWDAALRGRISERESVQAAGGAGFELILKDDCAWAPQSSEEECKPCISQSSIINSTDTTTQHYKHKHKDGWEQAPAYK